ncbi:RNA exonuclease 3 [Paramarasmius palmivorus]|uniref:RNA exonuclease 3 n=1 Tax=Paramarasmius palmivorus TaxID=297713 RepID=A0AAW0E5N2_9AGAR
MFPTLQLFSVKCPDQNQCTRQPFCVFSHSDNAQQTPDLKIPVASSSSSKTTSSASSSTPKIPQVVPAKRPVSASPSPQTPPEPPRKLQRGIQSRPVPQPQQQSNNGPPVLRVNPALSQVAIPVRQAMLKTLYEHFLTLYERILPNNPTLASEHALKQEEEIYSKSSKFTYRNAIIQGIAALKRRPIPDSSSHPSVGTEAEIAERAEAEKSLKSLRLTRKNLEPYIISLPDLEKWGYIVKIPDGPGGDEPSKEGQMAKCERCGEPFMVQRNPKPDECLHHWGRLYSRKISGERTRIYSCCSKTQSGEGCVHGTHVFYESDPQILHARHPFSNLSPSAPSSSRTTLDVAALDCEMIYTTGGLRIARVSIVDGEGKQVFDELIRMDEGVEILDYNTRFSGITAEEYNVKALLPLSSIRRSLDALLDADTILIGHALENDLRTLRIVHQHCVDTAIMFPHPAGAPYRRALRDL